MYTSLAVGATALAAIFLFITFGLCLAIVIDARKNDVIEAARSVWKLIVFILLASPVVGVAVLFWHKALA